MTPSAREILEGCAAGMAAPVPPEASGEYLAGRMQLFGLLQHLASLEAERAPSDCRAENVAIRALFAEAGRHDAALGGALGRAAVEVDGADLDIEALDAANAQLRRQLIALHERVEEAGDAALERQILGLYCRMAAGRRMDLPRG
ncbi:MAG: hypothetical protein ACHP7N_11455 [Caulobacterales bacterium]